MGWLAEEHPVNIFSADMYRSGSTHIQMGLCNMLPGWRPASLTRLHGEGGGEQNINPLTIAVLAPYGHYVFGGHHAGYSDTIALLNNHGIKPMVCIRNLYDTVVSIYDRLNTLYTDYPDWVPAFPGVRIPKEWNVMLYEDKLDFIAYHAVPWQTKFFVSWKEAFDIDKLFVKYEEFYANQQGGWRRILDFYGLEHPTQEHLDWCAAQLNNNFNVGVVGRGDTLPKSTKSITDSIVDSWGKDTAAAIRKELYR